MNRKSKEKSKINGNTGSETKFTKLGDTRSDGNDEKIDQLNERLLTYKLALSNVIQDANFIVNSKWWIMTSPLRKLSNSLRKRRGRSKKVWQNNFTADFYLRGKWHDENTQLIDSDRSANTLNYPLCEPKSGLPYPSNIPAINYSSVSEDHVEYRIHTEEKYLIKTIAFYLPQFHPFEENDKWWGKGFTEWTNVGKASPLYDDHYQPHCPIHLGYYDLRIPSIMEEQAKMAKNYGIGGFAYYFYWFGGKLLMESPLEAMLNNPKVDIPFCLIWANENWTRRWDGLEDDVLISQDHSTEDSRNLFNYVKKYFDDPRYLKVDGKPIFVIYRPNVIPEMQQTIQMWRDEAIRIGYPGIYLISVNAFGHSDPGEYGFDAIMAFPPHATNPSNITQQVEGLATNFTGSIFDYEDVVGKAVTKKSTEFKYYPTSMLSWDNSARKGKNANIFHNFSVGKYAQWLSANAERIMRDQKHTHDEKLVFVNAWNEWAEGTHLEPDQKHGFGYLEATRNVMANYSHKAKSYWQPEIEPRKLSNVAAIVHIHFYDIVFEVAEALKKIKTSSIDIYVTVTSIEAAEEVKKVLPHAYVEMVDNRGRDIRPFLYMYKKIGYLGYDAILKIHGKKSLHRIDGDMLRATEYESLCSDQALNIIKSNLGVGILGNKRSLLPHDGDKFMVNNLYLVEEVCREIGVEYKPSSFPAGSMFWFKPDALLPLMDIDQNDFDIERGMVDGTRPHAIERLFCTVTEQQGYIVEAIS